jgi:hypothetical protein
VIHFGCSATGGARLRPRRRGGRKSPDGGCHGATTMTTQAVLSIGTSKLSDLSESELRLWRAAVLPAIETESEFAERAKLSIEECRALAKRLYARGWLHSPGFPYNAVAVANHRRVVTGRLVAAARKAVSRAVRSGRLVKPSACSSCGHVTPVARLHGHHRDHRRPLDVAWLCDRCHRAEHGCAS